MGVASAGLSDIGKKRQINQDSIFLNDEILLYIVADGMGGHKSGDVASKMAIQVMSKFIFENISNNPKDLLKDSVTHTNAKLFEESNRNPDLEGMGTTITSVLFRDSTLYVANVGDSRTYMINDGMLYQLSKDHSLVQEKINLGLYTREEGARDKQKNVLVKTVGFEPFVEPDIYTYKVNKGDIFMLCSDGLHGKVNDHDIICIINKYIPNAESSSKAELENASQALVDLANKNGGNDNISVIIAVAK